MMKTLKEFGTGSGWIAEAKRGLHVGLGRRCSVGFMNDDLFVFDSKEETQKYIDWCDTDDATKIVKDSWIPVEHSWGDDAPPRRNRVDKMTPAELAITKAMESVEEAGCDTRLTEAVILLGEARDKVADFVDGNHECDKALDPDKLDEIDNAVSHGALDHEEDSTIEKDMFWLVQEVKWQRKLRDDAYDWAQKANEKRDEAEAQMAKALKEMKSSDEVADLFFDQRDRARKERNILAAKIGVVYAQLGLNLVTNMPEHIDLAIAEIARLQSELVRSVPL